MDRSQEILAHLCQILEKITVLEEAETVILSAISLVAGK